MNWIFKNSEDVNYIFVGCKFFVNYVTAQGQSQSKQADKLLQKTNKNSTVCVSEVGSVLS